MNKTELIQAVAVKAGLSITDTESVIDAFEAVLLETLPKDKKISLRGFGDFRLDRRKERNGRNPATGEAVKIEAKNVLKFKTSPNFLSKLQ